MRRAWIVCSVAVAGHLALLHAAGLWAPRSVRNDEPGEPPLLFVSLPAPAASADPVGDGKSGVAMQSAPVLSRSLDSRRKASLRTDANPEQEGPAHDGPAAGDIHGTRFYTSTEVARQALPASALELLDVMALVTDPSTMMLRVYIDSDGAVLRAEIVRVSDGNHAAAARLALILMETRFVPAKRLGADVAAVRELEFQIEPSSGNGQPALL